MYTEEEEEIILKGGGKAISRLSYTIGQMKEGANISVKQKKFIKRIKRFLLFFVVHCLKSITLLEESPHTSLSLQVYSLLLMSEV